MDYNYPQKVLNSQTNTIRVVMERGAKIDGFVSLALGNPAMEAIPQKEIIEAIKEISENKTAAILQYGPALGYGPLRDYTMNHVKTYQDIDIETNGLLLMVGSGQGLGFVPRMMCEEGDVMFADEFTFPNGVNAAINSGLTAKGIKADTFGMIPEELEKVAKEGKGRYIYLIPNFHNPMGMTMPLERRKELYELARKYDLLIYEDDPYGEIRFKGKPVPSFKSFDIDGRVLYAGSYSKVLSAGLRVGYLVADKKIIQNMIKVKATVDGQSPLFNQMIVHESLQKLDYNSYIQNVCNVYGRKCRLLTDGIDKYCSNKLKYVMPEGGMFLWLELPEDADAEAFFEDCMAQGIGIVPSKAFAVDPQNNPGHAFRLNYTFIEDEDIEKAVRVLGDVSHKHCG